MDADIRTEWTTALRSGKFEQGRGALRSADDTFCCLGVLCQLAANKGIIPQPRLNDYNGAEYRYGEAGASAFLPQEVVDWSGVPMGGDISRDGQPLVFLASENDGGKTFREIAELIEENA